MWAIKNLCLLLAILGSTQTITGNINIKESLRILKSRQTNEVRMFKESQQPLESSQTLIPSNDCLIGCPRILDPICAVDDTKPKVYKYFHNQCLMESDSCRKGKAWRPTQMLLCIADVDTLLRADCMRVCPLIYNPICASDGTNYEVFANPCIFGIEKCLDSGKWLVVHAELCGLRNVKLW